MEDLKAKILDSDMLVFVTPLYYFGFSTQLKTVIDRFYSFNGELTSKGLKTALIVAAWDSNPQAMEHISGHYQALCRCLHFKDQGMILGGGCGSVPIVYSSLSGIYGRNFYRGTFCGKSKRYP